MGGIVSETRDERTGRSWRVGNIVDHSSLPYPECKPYRETLMTCKHSGSFCHLGVRPYCKTETRKKGTEQVRG